MLPIEEDVQIDCAKTFDAFAWTPSSTRRFVSFEWIMARHLFLIVHRLMHLALSPVAVKFYLPFLEQLLFTYTFIVRNFNFVMLLTAK